jgi:hypothetical protein
MMKVYLCAIMLKNYLVKQGLLGLLAALLIHKFFALNEFAKPLWYAFAFINVLFIVLYFIANESLKTKTHKEFIAVFGVLFSVKIGAVLVWLAIAIYSFHLRSNEYVLTFFALYLSYTFLLAVQVFNQTRKQQ